jgi:hypothetical protein
VPVRIRFPDQADHTCPRRIAVTPCDGACSIIDLGLTTFAKPFGITLLHGLIRQMREHGEAVRVVVPQVATYLWRVRLHEPFQDDQNVTFEPNIKLFAFSRWFRPEEVLELTAINVADDDEVVAAERSLWGIIKARAPQFIPLGEQIRTALVELISNVERHSQTGRATVIAQTHRDCVRLAVGDVGIGVRQSLAGAYDLRVRSDHEVADRAFIPFTAVTRTAGSAA